MERKIKNLELKKSGNFVPAPSAVEGCLCELLPAMSSVEPSSKFNLLCFFFSLCGYHWVRLVRVRYIESGSPAPCSLVTDTVSARPLTRTAGHR
jgi:hypothetical protein